MSLLTAILLPLIEKELKEMAPEASQALIALIKAAGQQAVAWAETKLNVDIDGDGKIGK